MKFHLRIANFQSLGAAEATIEGVTVLVGPSDRGKSALVRAIEGAVFNKPGDYFVRDGTSYAEVTLRWEEGLDVNHHMVGHQITWTKGSGQNSYHVDGELFAKVGVKAPEILQTLGFREILIGARMKEDGPDGGEWIRPQVAGQFDGPFLLQKSGTFLSEVIVKLSRLGVLQRAERQCALDLRQGKQLLVTRQKDLAVATKAAEALAEVPRLRDRLTLLHGAELVISANAAKLGELSQFVKQRGDSQRRIAHPLPAKQATLDKITALATQYTALQNARTGILLRAKLAAVPKKLPKAHKSLTPLDVAHQRWQALQDVLGRRELALVNLDTAQHAVQRVEAQVVSVQAAMTQFIQENPTCPVCARPWSTATPTTA